MTRCPQPIALHFGIEFRQRLPPFRLAAGIGTGGSYLRKLKSLRIVFNYRSN